MREGDNRKIAWITGGTRGLGRELVRHFLAEGFVVIASYASDEKAAEALRQGSPVSVIKADVRDDEALARVAGYIAERYGRLDILVNNAGIGSAGSTDETATGKFQEIIDVNVSGKYRCLKAALPLLRKSDYPCVVNVASASGVNASAEMGAYCTAAAGIIMMTKCAARDLARDKIRVNCVSPSMMESGMSRECFSESDMEAVRAGNPSGRLATPDDVIKCISWLCSTESAYVNGENILMTGGN